MDILSSVLRKNIFYIRVKCLFFISSETNIENFISGQTLSRRSGEQFSSFAHQGF